MQTLPVAPRSDDDDIDDDTVPSELVDTTERVQEAHTHCIQVVGTTTRRGY